MPKKPLAIVVRAAVWDSCKTYPSLVDQISRCLQATPKSFDLLGFAVFLHKGSAATSTTPLCADPSSKLTMR